MQADTATRLLARIAREDNGCWRWTGAHIPQGYGQISISGKARRVHIVAHEAWIGPIPDGCEIDHVYARGCRYRDCINPAHLEAVPHAENCRRIPPERAARPGRLGRGARPGRLQDGCARGHEFTPENTRIRKNGKRLCIECARERNRRWRARRVT